MAGQSKRELKKEQQIKEENIRKLEEQMQENKKIPKTYQKKINKKIILNVVTLIVMLVYVACINISSLYMDTTVYLKYLRILSVILCVISIAYFELSYRKDNEEIFLYGVEVLILALVTLFSNYAYFLFYDRYNQILIAVGTIIATYFLIKILIVNRRMKKDYYKQMNDIKDIVQKNRRKEN